MFVIEPTQAWATAETLKNHDRDIPNVGRDQGGKITQPSDTWWNRGAKNDEETGSKNQRKTTKDTCNHYP
jgi:glycogen debranching enzyme